MQVVFTKKFQKQLVKLPNKVRIKTLQTLELFELDPFDPQLRNHELCGRWDAHRSIDVTGDVRAIYFVVEDDIAKFMSIGTHSQLYK